MCTGKKLATTFSKLSVHFQSTPVELVGVQVKSPTKAPRLPWAHGRIEHHHGFMGVY